MVVIEMNPRVSRSSALASKATGFPDRQGRRAAGGRLHPRRADERHHRRDARPRSSRSIDYVVTKIPRFAFEKYPGAEPYLTTSMKSVGEVMAIGRTFAESLQKALRGLETGPDRPRRDRHPGRRRCRERPRRGPCARWACRRPTGCGSSPRLSAMASTSRRSPRPAPTSPGSCARSRRWWPRSRRLRRHGLPRRRRRRCGG